MTKMPEENLSIEQSFDLAVQHYQKGNFQEAENLYRKILEANPKHYQSLGYLGLLAKQSKKYDISKKLLEKVIQINPNLAEARNNLGLLYQELGEYQKAINCYQKAVQINPNLAEPHSNLGLLYRELGEYQKAINCYQKAVQINPNFVKARNNLGLSYQELGEYQKAINCYQKAVQINPNLAEPHSNLGLLYRELGEYQKAINCYQKAVQINPNFVKARNNLGLSYQELGEYQKAINCYQKAIHLYNHALVLNPNNLRAYNNREIALHLLNSQAGVTTKTASEDYIKTLFDDYAKRFDHHLTTILDYKVPQFLINSLYTLIGSDLIFDNVIDLGCGTGLSGKEFRPISKRLVGIDLSPKMIEIAEGKRIYDLIENIEVNKYLETKSEKYDLFIATDLLIYVGDPTQLFSNISKTSKAKAIFLFSTESTQDKDYILTNQGRYAHSEEYIHRLAKLNKFTILNVENATIRTGIEGHLFILRYLG